MVGRKVCTRTTLQVALDYKTRSNQILASMCAHLVRLRNINKVDKSGRTSDGGLGHLASSTEDRHQLVTAATVLKQQITYVTSLNSW